MLYAGIRCGTSITIRFLSDESNASRLEQSRCEERALIQRISSDLRRVGKKMIKYSRDTNSIVEGWEMNLGVSTSVSSGNLRDAALPFVGVPQFASYFEALRVCASLLTCGNLATTQEAKHTNCRLTSQKQHDLRLRRICRKLLLVQASKSH